MFGIEPINPQEHKCEYCDNRANGSVGDMYDDTVCLWVCEDCYYNKLKMRPLIDQILDGTVKLEDIPKHIRF